MVWDIILLVVVAVVDMMMLKDRRGLGVDVGWRCGPCAKTDGLGGRQQHIIQLQTISTTISIDMSDFNSQSTSLRVA